MVNVARLVPCRHPDDVRAFTVLNVVDGCAVGINGSFAVNMDITERSLSLAEEPQGARDCAHRVTRSPLPPRSPRWDPPTVVRL
jgi:hypothetical protein